LPAHDLILAEPGLARSIRKRINCHDRRRGYGDVDGSRQADQIFMIRSKSNCNEDIGSKDRIDRSVVGLTWIDAMVYIAWINGTEAVSSDLMTVLRDGV
jgi:hypothetical protein